MISIIIPVYNTASYLKKCLDSCLGQTYKDIEIIAVNDGSTDDSGSILDNYSQADRRVKVIHVENGGAAKARMIGVHHSNYQWIAFVDSDDWLIHSKSIQTLIESADVDEYDILLSKIIYSNQLHSYTPTKPSAHTHTISYSRSEYLLKQLRREIDVGPCAKLYRKSLLTDDVFDVPRDIIRGEDAIMNIRIGVKTKKILHTEIPFYIYFRRENSICNTFKMDLDHEIRYETLLTSPLLASEKLSKKLHVAIVQHRLTMIWVMICHGCKLNIESAWLDESYKMGIRIIKKISLKQFIALYAIKNRTMAYLISKLYQLKMKYQ